MQRRRAAMGWSGSCPSDAMPPRSNVDETDAYSSRNIGFTASVVTASGRRRAFRPAVVVVVVVVVVAAVVVCRLRRRLLSSLTMLTGRVEGVG